MSVALTHQGWGKHQHISSDSRIRINSNNANTTDRSESTNSDGSGRNGQMGIVYSVYIPGTELCTLLLLQVIFSK